MEQDSWVYKAEKCCVMSKTNKHKRGTLQQSFKTNLTEGICNKETRSRAFVKNCPPTTDMMSQHAALTSLFGDDPFFSQERMLWPLQHKDFFNRRTKLASSLLKELHDGPHLLQLGQLPLISSTLARLRDDNEHHRATSSTELHKDTQHAAENNGELLVTLDARGYAPSDISVKLEGRSLAVVAMKQAGAEESQSCSSSSSCASFCSSASSRTGFVQRIDLPAHLDLSGLSCSLMDGGQLRIHAPVAKQAIGEEQEAPGRFRSSLEFPITKDKTEKDTD